MKTPTINSRVVKLEVLKGTATRASVNAVESRTTSLESDVATAQGDISTLQGNVTTLTQGIVDAVSTHNTATDSHADIRTVIAGKQDSLTISTVGTALLNLSTPAAGKILRVNADASVTLIDVPSNVEEVDADFVSISYNPSGTGVVGGECFELFDDYALGDVVVLSFGGGWLGIGTCADHSCNVGSETFEDYAAGDVSTLAGGSGFSGPTTLTLYTE